MKDWLYLIQLLQQDDSGNIVLYHLVLDLFWKKGLPQELEAHLANNCSTVYTGCFIVMILSTLYDLGQPQEPFLFFFVGITGVAFGEGLEKVKSCVDIV
ncbi:unnamed protein product [Rhizophagus irregularis]|uniref:Uncharacterized protein n=1 Tax=Rhizophagus irregularis TaxID=588596 RepID=A0A915Z693_9GLOM|nr:unnamed protein product [Rhizophagus irregularis]